MYLFDLILSCSVTNHMSLISRISCDILRNEKSHEDVTRLDNSKMNNIWQRALWKKSHKQNNVLIDKIVL